MSHVAAFFAAMVLTVAIGCGKDAAAHHALGEVDLQAALLTLEDLPPGYAVVPIPTDEDVGATPCGSEGSPRGEADAQVRAHFCKGGFGPYISHIVSSFSGVRAKEGFEAAIEVFEECRSWTTTDTNGNPATFTISLLSFPKLGDQSYAVTIDATYNIGVSRSELVLVRRGNLTFLLVSAIAGAAGVQVDTSLTRQLAREADMRLSALR